MKCRPLEFHKAHLSAQHKAIGDLQTQDWAAADESNGVKSAEYEKGVQISKLEFDSFEIHTQKSSLRIENPKR